METQTVSKTRSVKVARKTKSNLSRIQLKPNPTTLCRTDQARAQKQPPPSPTPNSSTVAHTLRVTEMQLPAFKGLSASKHPPL